MGLRLRWRRWLGAAAAVAACAQGHAQSPIHSRIESRPQDEQAARSDPAAVAQGAALSRLGDCAVCHTAPGGRAYAGGGKVSTPFGVIYGTNITPDPDTGIGRWSLKDFDGAMRRGRRKGGAPLYPAMPYDHYASMTPQDVGALYAFLMTRAPVRSRPPPNRLIPPLGLRPLMYVWKALFFRPQPTPEDRGAYLTQTLGHCGACHAPHGAFGQEEREKGMDGGWAEGWYAPALDARTPASSAWTEERLYAYLRTGLDVDHAAAAGPMGAVAHELARAPESDVRALAAFIARSMRPANRPEAPPVVDHARDAARLSPRGASLFDGACAVCHGPGAPMMSFAGRPGLERGSPLWEDDPRDALKIVLDGLQPPIGAAGPFMPPFADAISTPDLAALAGYLRARYTDKPPWPRLDRQAQRARSAQ